MTSTKLPDFFSPFLGAVIAASTSPKGIAISMCLAVFGGAAGWLGKYFMKALFMYLKDKFSNESKG